MIKNVAEWLDITAEKYPDKTAFASADSSLTFSQLKSEALSAATLLCEKGIFKKPVLCLLDKSPRCISAFMGAAYSGNFYIPTDTEMPPQRIQKIIDVLSPAAIITEEKFLGTVNQLQHSAEVFGISQMVSAERRPDLVAAAMSRQIDTDLVYAIFTSGSTGVPKGVAINHRSVIDYISVLGGVMGVDDSFVWGNITPFHFDKSIKDIYFPLQSGCSTFFLNKANASFPIRLVQEMIEQNVNAIDWAPTLYAFTAFSRTLKKIPPKGLKLVSFSGEVMTNKVLNEWRAAVPDAMYINVYGPTEITGTCSCYIVDREFADDESLPIGKAYRNTEILLLDGDKEAPLGEIGEICVRGTSLAAGYYNNPEKTAEVFTQNPLNAAYPERIYHTGDLGYINGNGEIIYVGRKDMQIKVAGHRIELGEIETAASAVSGVVLGAAVYNEEKKQIVFFYEGEVDDKTLVAKLKEALLPYMVPNRFVKLDKMPVMNNGKVNRVALKEMLNQSKA